MVGHSSGRDEQGRNFIKQASPPCRDYNSSFSCPHLQDAFLFPRLSPVGISCASHCLRARRASSVLAPCRRLNHRHRWGLGRCLPFYDCRCRLVWSELGEKRRVYQVLPRWRLLAKRYRRCEAIQGQPPRLRDDTGIFAHLFSEDETLTCAQFGHNDQKPTSYVTLAQYTTNLGNMANEVVSAGGTPILVTPLTRRTFSGGKVVENLSNETAKTIEVAKKQSQHYIDLNKASTAYVNAIGGAAADKYNLAAGDRTHVNAWGGVMFARIVSDLLVAGYSNEFKDVTVANATLSAAIKAGNPA
jgi:hypothetical protein